MERTENRGRENREKWELILGSLASETNASIIVNKKQQKTKQVEC